MPSRLSNKLAAERHRRGWSQSHVAELGGITRQSYAAIESGDAVPSTEIALRLAAAFGRRVEELFRLPEAAAERVVARWAGGEGGGGGRVRIGHVAGQAFAFPAGASERPAREADGIVTTAVESDRVEVSLFRDRPPAPDLVVAGCDPAFGVVAEVLRRERGVEILWISRGSRAALEALARGEAHVAGAHLRDPTGDSYNVAWVRNLVPFQCTRVSFALWEQGILVEAGNPKRIGGIQDLVRPDIRFLNRENGSGSRALLDEHLLAQRIPGSSIPGYETHAGGHLAVAEAIASGLADAGVGIRAAGNSYGLGVLPLGFEPYELIIPNHFLDHPSIQALLETLRRPGLQTQIEALGGYDLSRIGEAC